MGMSKCRALHTHMIKVLRQKERIPNVPRCVGSGFHKNEGSPGEVVLLAGVSIYFIYQQRIARSRDHDRPRRGSQTTTLDSEQQLFIPGLPYA